VRGSPRFSGGGRLPLGGFCRTPRALAARNLGLERIELVLPEGAELIEPFYGFL
jgi:hypothetical protein